MKMLPETVNGTKKENFEIKDSSKVINFDVMVNHVEYLNSDDREQKDN